MKLSTRWMMLVAGGVLVGALALAAVACGDDNEESEEPTATEAMAPTEPATGEIPQVDIVGKDYSFDAPASIAGGLTQINFTNASAQEDHQAQLVRLNEGVTFDDFTAALETLQTEADAESLGTLAGGPAAGPGGANSNVTDLAAGQYVLLCLIPNPEGVPHAALGMIQPLEVTEAPAAQPELPIADASVGMSDFEFQAPASLSAGEVTIEAVNNGPQPHEMAVIQLAEGLTVDDLLEMFAAPPDPNAPAPEGPPPLTLIGGVSVLSDGGSERTTLDLAPGTYTLLCFVTDPETGAPHAALGMWTDIVVN